MAGRSCVQGVCSDVIAENSLTQTETLQDPDVHLKTVFANDQIAQTVRISSQVELVEVRLNVPCDGGIAPTVAIHGVDSAGKPLLGTKLVEANSGRAAELISQYTPFTLTRPIAVAAGDRVAIVARIVDAVYTGQRRSQTADSSPARWSGPSHAGLAVRSQSE